MNKMMILYECIVLFIIHSFCVSLAGLVRFHYDNKSADEMKERTTILFKLAKQLKWLSDTFNVCVVVVNQVRLWNDIDFTTATITDTDTDTVTDTAAAVAAKGGDRVLGLRVARSSMGCN